MFRALSSSWWWAYKCPKHVEQIISAIKHSVAFSWFSSLRLYYDARTNIDQIHQNNLENLVFSNGYQYAVLYYKVSSTDCLSHLPVVIFYSRSRMDSTCFFYSGSPEFKSQSRIYRYFYPYWGFSGLSLFFQPNTRILLQFEPWSLPSTPLWIHFF